MEKHSGQRMGVLIPHKSVSVVEALLHTGIGNFVFGTEMKAVHSVIYTLENMSALIQILDGQKFTRTQYLNVWNNLFDNSEQEKNKGFLEQLCEIYYNHFAQGQSGIQALTDEKMENERYFRAFTTLLRIDKFLKEKKGDRE